MTHKLRTRLSATLLTGAATVALACAGTATAQADVGQPTTSNYVVFTVLDPGAVKPATAVFEGGLFVIPPTMAASDLQLTLLCDDGVPYPLTFTRYDNDLSFRADLPLRLVGHTCTLTSFPKNGQTVLFSTPHPDGDKGAHVTNVNGQLVTVVPPRRGGQY
ncbi:hypothetical protein [Subtercola lobariae]|uniref:Uncharacterized protein n=1 Tax=Subtercola lobariae TaxID=1588641 RepID=A0A917F0Q8_9MICO|nr:hypothetical protein [Subtercola lobariae]GGF40772.1 hypothetical protein GCM10011399_36930 [Subtercola lobariae]